MAIKHNKVSGVSDSGVGAQVQPSNWNAEHEVDGLLGALIALAVVPSQVPYIDADGNGATFTISTWARTVLMALVSQDQFVTDMALAPILSPAFMGIPTTPDAPLGDNTGQVANTKFVQTAIDNLIAAAPGALDTLNELATALGDDPNFATTVTNALALKAPLDSPALTGTPTAPTVAGTTDNTTTLATTAFVQAVRALLAPLDSPALTGTPTATTVAGSTDDSTKIATTAFVQAVATALSTALSLAAQPSMRNALDNGAFEIWQRNPAGITRSSPSGSRTFSTDRFYVKPSGAALAQIRSAVVPSGSPARYSLELDGAVSVTTVLIGQRMMADRTAPITATSVVFQAQIYNGSGAAFTPQLLLGTPAASNDFTTVTNKLTQNLQACPDGAWTQVSWIGDTSGYANIANGLQVEVQIPTGVLVATKLVRVTEVQLAPGLAVTKFSRLSASEDLSRCQRNFCKSFPQDTAPAQAVGSLAGVWVCVPATSPAGGGAVSARWPVAMAGTPTVVLYNPYSFATAWRDVVSSADVASVVSEACDTSARITINGTSVVGHIHAIQTTAEFEP